MPLAFEDGEVPLEWRIANPLGSYNDWVDSLGARHGFVNYGDFLILNDAVHGILNTNKLAY